jgi:hypothetical protein
MEEKFHLSYPAKDIDARLKKVDDIPYKVSELENDKGYITAKDIPSVELPDNIATLDDVAKKQDKLVSGENIKTINGQSILGEGNITIEGGNGNVDLSGYVTKVDADKTYQPKGDYAELTDIPTKVSDLENDKEYISLEDVDFTDYLTKEEAWNAYQPKGDYVEVVETNEELADVDTLKVVKFVEQSLSEEEKAQARANIGAIAALPSNLATIENVSNMIANAITNVLNEEV